MVDQDNAGIVPINTRSPAQWAVISTYVDFDWKNVLDVGCGNGDLLLYAQQEGAVVFGVDHKQEIVESAKQRGLWVTCADLNDYMERAGDHYDVVFCFSVLPYVDNFRTLRNLAAIADVAFVESQLTGDGPGYMDEEELHELFLQYWDKVTCIGSTRVEIRDTVRPIWMCERGKGNG